MYKSEDRLMRGRRESFAWGSKFMELLPKLKTKEIKRIRRQCRAYLRQIEAFAIAAKDDPASVYTFREGEREYRLQYKDEIGVWVVDPAPHKRAATHSFRAMGAAQAIVQRRSLAGPGKPSPKAPLKTRTAKSRKPRKPVARPKPADTPD